MLLLAESAISEDKIFNSLLSGGLALIGAIIGALIARAGLKKQIQASNISSPRVSWINQLKILTSEYISQCQKVVELYNSSNAYEKENINILDEILFSKIKLVLHINSISGIEDKFVIKTIDNIYESLNEYLKDYKEQNTRIAEHKKLLTDNLNCLIFLITGYTKIEWEKIKNETSIKKAKFSFEDYLFEHEQEREKSFDILFPEFKKKLDDTALEICKKILIIIMKKSHIRIKSIYHNSTYSKEEIKKYIFPYIDKKYGEDKFSFTWYVNPFAKKLYKRKELIEYIKPLCKKLNITN